MNQDNEVEQEIKGIEAKINLEDQEIKLQEILDCVEEILPGKKDMVLLALAVCASHFIEHQTPLWLMFVGVPACAKTEIVRLLQYDPKVKLLDSLTENAFISGARNKDGTQPTDLLPLLDGMCFIIKDFTTTLSQREESVRKILGDLTSIYDDTFAKHSPARGTIECHSFFAFLGCVTPQTLNNHQRYMSQIGPRFLFYRIPTATDKEIDNALDISWLSDKKGEKTETIRKKVSAYSMQMAKKAKDYFLGKESQEVQTFINKLAKFIAKARGTVLTRVAKFENEEGKEITFYEPYDIQIEEPHRAIRQLIVLARSLAYVSDKDSVDNETLILLKKVALSSMPANRSALVSIISAENKKWTAKEIADSLGISHKTASRQLDELVSLKILIKEEQGNGLANNYSVDPIFEQIVYSSVEFVSSPATTETETPQQDDTDGSFNEDNPILEQIDNLFGIDSISSTNKPR